jgi:hypothetical protein
MPMQRQDELRVESFFWSTDWLLAFLSGDTSQSGGEKGSRRKAPLSKDEQLRMVSVYTFDDVTPNSLV